jgi:ribosome biogenesis protein UTP30
VGKRADNSQTLRASQILLKEVHKSVATKAATASKKNLLDEGVDEDSTTVATTPIWLLLTTKRHIHNSNALKPKKVILPHALNTDPDTRICLITADPQRAYKNIVASDEFPDELRKKITRVIDFTRKLQ